MLCVFSPWCSAGLASLHQGLVWCIRGHRDLIGHSVGHTTLRKDSRCRPKHWERLATDNLSIPPQWLAGRLGLHPCAKILQSHGSHLEAASHFVVYSSMIEKDKFAILNALYAATVHCHISFKVAMLNTGNSIYGLGA